jgi:hypothetical protein
VWGWSKGVHRQPRGPLVMSCLHGRGWNCWLCTVWRPDQAVSWGSTSVIKKPSYLQNEILVINVIVCIHNPPHLPITKSS